MKIYTCPLYEIISYRQQKVDIVNLLSYNFKIKYIRFSPKILKNCYTDNMVIGFDGSEALTGKRTGVENYSYQVILNLAKIDRKNHYIVYLDPRVNKVDESKWPENFQFKVLKYPLMWTQVGLGLQTFKDKLDILFIPSHTLPLIRRPGLKTVVTVHDLGSEYLPQTHQLKQRLYLGLMQKFQLKTATKILAVSLSTRQDLISRIGLEPKKITVIYEGYDQKLFKRVRTDLLINRLKRFDLVYEKYFLFLGTVQPRKNLERLIQAFAKYSSGEVSKLLSNTVRSSHYVSNGIKLAIVGKKGWLSDPIYELPKKLGVEDRVRFLGYVGEPDLPILYSGALGLLYPSLFEGFGLPILEAQACGCPVLTSNLSSMPEVVDKSAVLVDPYNINDIVEGIRKMDNRKRRVELIKAGYENIKRFSWEKCARETLKVLENL